jgi:hypothetical protein
MATQKLVDLCDPKHSVKQESIEEEPEPESATDQTTDHKQREVRLTSCNTLGGKRGGERWRGMELMGKGMG